MINDRVAYSEHTDAGRMFFEAEQVDRHFKVPVLNECGVRACTMIDGVPSKMNDPHFMIDDIE